jgi:hypothetical protein
MDRPRSRKHPNAMVSIDYASGVSQRRPVSKAQRFLSALSGCGCLVFSLFTCYRETQLPLDIGRTVQQGATVHMFVVDGAQAMLGLFAVAVCGVLGLACVLLHPKSVMAWVLAIVGFGLALASHPIGVHFTNQVMVSHGLIDN